MFEQHAHGYFHPVGASCARAGAARNDTDITAKAAQANKELFFKLSMSLSFSCSLLPTNHPPVCCFLWSVIPIPILANCRIALRETTYRISPDCVPSRTLAHMPKSARLHHR